jgi:hypothetical protein
VKQFSPFSLQDVPELAGQARTNPAGALGGLAAELSGVKSSPLSPTEELNRIAMQAYGRDFYDLEPVDKQTIKQANPEVWERAVERGSDARQQAEQVRAELRDRELASNVAVDEGRITTEEWVNAIDERRTEQRLRVSQIYGAGIVEGDEPYDRYIRAIQQSVDPETGILDGDVLGRALEADPEAQAAGDRNFGVGSSPRVRAFLQQRREYQDLPRYRGYTADEAYEIDGAWDEVRAHGRGQQLSQLRVLRRLIAERDLDPRVARAIRRRIMGDSLELDTARERYKRTHPLYAILSGQATLTAQQLRTLEREVAA